MAEYVPLYLPGDQVTLTASAAITAGQAVRVSGNGTIAAATQASHLIIGVASQDAAASGDKINVTIRGCVHRLLATGTVTAADVVEGATAGTVATHTQGTNDVRVFGVALTTATDALVEIMEV